MNALDQHPTPAEEVALDLWEVLAIAQGTRLELVSTDPVPAADGSASFVVRPDPGTEEYVVTVRAKYIP